MVKSYKGFVVSGDSNTAWLIVHNRVSFQSVSTGEYIQFTIPYNESE